MASQSITVQTDFSQAGLHVPADFLGLSFETGFLNQRGYFTGSNNALIQLVKNLSPKGVLRFGGNSSDFPGTVADSQALSDLGAFLNATGWSSVYGLNLLNGSAQQAASDGQLAASALGSRRLAFQIGNEPDLSPLSENDYIARWQADAQAVRVPVPGVTFGGPDVSFKSWWIPQFRSTTGIRPLLSFISRHYYPTQGNPTAPAFVLSKILGCGPDLDAALQDGFAQLGGDHLALRLTEVGSATGGGQPGISDRYAGFLFTVNACWGTAAKGWVGINFHGNPGASYSFIVTGSDGQPHATPVYFALRFFSRYGQGWFGLNRFAVARKATSEGQLARARRARSNFGRS